MAEQIHPRVAAVVKEDRGILDTFKMTLVKAWQGECEISAAVPAALVNAAGFAHGGMAYALMDTACAYALGSLEVRGVTISGNVNYVRGAKAGTVMRATVAIASRTRRVATFRCELFVEEEDGQKLAAHGSFVFQLIEGAD